MGRVALGHVKKGMQVALGTNAIRAAAASAGVLWAACPSHSLAMWAKKLVNLSSLNVRSPKRMTTPTICYTKRGINPGLATSFEKLAKLEAGRQSSMFDDHPASRSACTTYSRPYGRRRN